VGNLIGVEAAADRLGISVWTVYRWARAGRLVSIRLGRRRLFTEEDLQALITRARQPGRQGREGEDETPFPRLRNNAQ